MAYNDAALSAQDKEKISALKEQWETATAKGDFATAAKLHSAAENIRKGYGYSGGDDGSQFIPLEPEPEKTGYKAAKFSGATDRSEYINDLYKAREDAAVAQLEGAYKQNAAELDAAKREIPKVYYDAKNKTAATAAQERQAFNEYAAASGLSSGAGGQAELARTNQLQSDLRELEEAKASALADAALQERQLATNYKTAVAEAIAAGEAERAAALYDEAVRLDSEAIARERAQASEDYLAWQSEQTAEKAARADAREIVNTMLSYGLKPSDSMIAASGYSDADISAILAAAKASEAGTAAGTAPQAITQGQILAALDAMNKGKASADDYDILAAAGYNFDTSLENLYLTGSESYRGASDVLRQTIDVGTSFENAANLIDKWTERGVITAEQAEMLASKALEWFAAKEARA